MNTEISKKDISDFEIAKYKRKLFVSRYNIKNEEVSFYEYNPEFIIDAIIKDKKLFFTINNTEYAFEYHSISPNEGQLGYKSFGVYPGGRYLSFKINDGKVLLNFNFSFNLTCAYTSGMECKIPENIIDFEIKAGEKFPEKGYTK